MKTAHTSSKQIPPAVRGAFAGIVIIVLLMAGNGSAASDTPPATKPTTTTVSATTIPTSAPAAFKKPGLPEVPVYDLTGPMWHMLAAIAVVMVLGTLAYVVVKKVLPKISQAGGKRISLLETVYLQPRKALHLIQVGSRKLLIASSPEGLVRLDDVTDAIDPDYAETAQRIEDAEKASENRQDTAK